MSFEAAGDGVRVDLTEWAWVIGLYLDDLEGVLGAPPALPEDPLDALAASMERTAPPSNDPVLRRLLPDAVLDDPKAAEEFRRFTETALIERKRGDAVALRSALEAPSTVDDQAARRILGALNDLRLMLGTRLSVTEHGVLGGAEDLQSYATYQLLTMLQSDLVDVLAGDAP
jgi:hypothetical protein